MEKIRKYNKNRIKHYVGITKNFQGFGFIMSTANPYWINKYFLFEIRFLWFKTWITYDLSENE
jgi:hypothetical protein